MINRKQAGLLALVMLLTPASHGRAGDEPGPFVQSLWLIQRHGTTKAVDPRNDQKVKGRLFKALGKEGVLTLAGVNDLMDPSTFTKLAGSDGRLDAVEVRAALAADVPESRKRMAPAVVAHANLLTTSFDMIDEPHREAGDRLVEWIVKNYKPGQPLHLAAICTGNSRRSVFTATMGNVAAAYYGLPEIRVHSGGTAPSAINSRAIASLEEIGIVIAPTGSEAPRGEPATANPMYKVRWGQSGEADLEAVEFSKTYFDASNPQTGFAALLVCSEADEACPFVKGASARISCPFLDPKIYDGSTIEKSKYAERRDDIGRFALSVMMRVRNRLNNGN